MAIFPVISADTAAEAPYMERHDDVIGVVREHALEMVEHPDDMQSASWSEWFAQQRAHFAIKPAEMSESPTQVRLRLAAPGFLAEELEVTITPLTITIEGNLREDHELDAGRRHFTESATRHTLRQFELISPVDPDDAIAILEDGILTVTMEKANRN